mgnify:FL=1
MPLNLRKFSINITMVTLTALAFSVSATQVSAAEKEATKTTSKTKANTAKVKENKGSKSAGYTEDQFLNAFSGKTKSVVVAQLGDPAKKELSVKPAGASGYLGRVGADEKNSKKVNVEMWYYKDLVNYDPKNKYKETEITFVNDRVMNIAFFNNR